MTEVLCPFCFDVNTIDTADYRDEGVQETIECQNLSCGKLFDVVVSISWDYRGEVPE